MVQNMFQSIVPLVSPGNHPSYQHEYAITNPVKCGVKLTPYPFRNFSGATVEIWEWINDFILHFLMDVSIIHAETEVKA